MSELDDELDALPPSVRFAVLDAMEGRSSATTGRRSRSRPVAPEAPTVDDNQSKKLRAFTGKFFLVTLFIVVVVTALVVLYTLKLLDEIIRRMSLRIGAPYDTLYFKYNKQKGLDD